MTARKSLGFTLMEVITVVMIIGILAAIAYPSYLKMMQRTRRAEAATIINDQQLRVEKYRVDHSSYGDYWADGDAPKGATETAFYEIEVSGDETTYDITATPKSGPQSSDPCGTLTLSYDDGEVVRDDEAGGAEACW